MQAQLHRVHGIDPAAIHEELDLRTNRFVDQRPLRTVSAGVATRWIRATIGILFALGENLPADVSAHACQQGSACDERPSRWHSRSRPCDPRLGAT